MALAVLAAACGQQSETEPSVGTLRAALEMPAESARTLGFEEPSDWSPVFTASTERTEGESSLLVQSPGWVDVTSGTLAGVGNVGDTARLDVWLPASVSWGEVRLVLVMPSSGEHWRDLGGVSLSGLAPGEFHTLAWPLGVELRERLLGSYSDLQIHVTLNAPAGDYRLDALRFEGSSTSGGVAGATASLDLELPLGEPLDGFAVVGSEAVDLEDRSQLLEPDGLFARVAGTGSGTVNVGVEAKSGAIHARTNVSLRERAEVHGDVILGGSFHTESTWTVEGSVLPLPMEVTTLSRRVEFPAERLADVALEPAQRWLTPLSPGYRGRLELKADAEVTLQSGDYYLDTLMLHPGATLWVDDASGAVNLYVRSAAELQGSVARLGGGHPQLVLGYLGTGSVFVSAPFNGSLLAPGGALNLEGPNGMTHTGTFVGRRVRVAPEVRIVHAPVPWLIRGVSLSEDTICSGSTVTATVALVEPGTAVTINGIPATVYTEQFVGEAGTRLLSVAATSGGVTESRLVELSVEDCGEQAPRPLLVARPNRYRPDSTDFVVSNAAVFEDQTQWYSFTFGDGTTLDSAFPAVTHDYSAALGPDDEVRVFDVAVTVHRSGLPDVATQRTLAVWNSYALSKRRGSIEPFVEVGDGRMRRAALGRYSAVLTLHHREPTTLTFTERRIDVVPCDGEAAPRVGAPEADGITVPPGVAVSGKVRLAASAIHDGDCAVRVHLWGATEDGTPAQATAYLDLPSDDLGAPIADPAMAALLDYVIERGLVSDPHLITEEELGRLYRERRIPLTAVTETHYALYSTEPSGRCDPDDPGSLNPGYTCQPTGDWIVDLPRTPEGEPLDPRNSAHVENALKGDTLMVRSCNGAVGPLLAAVEPPQIYTHVGIMTKNRTELRHSTAEESYLQEAGSDGLSLDGEVLPTDGFKEEHLRYQWPGAVTASVYEAFAKGRPVMASSGKEYRIKGFNADEESCFGTGIVYPRVLKPEPRFEAETRPRLHRAAEAARRIDGHYRLGGYSNAVRSGFADPRGPAAIAPASDDPYGDPWWGPQPTVCSSFVRQALVDAGIEVDRDVTFPRPSPLPPQLLTIANERFLTLSPPPGLYLYHADERRAGADALFAFLHNKASVTLWELEETTDPYWWVGTAGGALGGAIVGGVGGFLVGGPFGVVPGLVYGTGTGIVAGTAAGGNVGLVAKWATDAPRDVANQVTNCFATDACAHEDRNNQRWKRPGSGVAVSPDDLMNYYDSPATGGVYGYHERLVFRGLRFRPVFTWQRAEGAFDLDGRVTLGGLPAESVSVEAQGVVGTATTTTTDGLFTLLAIPGPNVRVHASRWVGEEATGHLAEAYACLVAVSDTETGPESITYFHQVLCNDLSATADTVRVLPGVATRTGCFAPDPSDPALLVRIACDGSGVQLGEERYRERLELELGSPDPANRHVVLSGRAHVTDCDCTNPDDGGWRQVFAVCDVDPLSPTDTFSVSKQELCADEVGLEVKGTCELLESGRVRVSVSLKLYGSQRSGSCGLDVKDSDSFTVEVAPGATRNTGFLHLSHLHYCGGFLFVNGCDDTAVLYSGLDITNGVAP